MQAGRAMWAQHPLFRLIFALYSPKLKKVKNHYTTAAEFLKPIIDQRFKDMEQKDFKKPDDMIQYMIYNLGKHAKDALFQAPCQLVS